MAVARFAPHVALHAKVRLREAHLAPWLHLWFDTVDELFAGDRAELAKAHALRVGQAFSSTSRTAPPSIPPGTDRISRGFAERPDSRRCALRRPVKFVEQGEIVVADSTDVESSSVAPAA